MDRALDLKPEIVGLKPGSGRKSTTAPRAPHSWLPTAPSVCRISCLQKLTLVTPDTDWFSDPPPPPPPLVLIRNFEKKKLIKMQKNAAENHFKESNITS